MGRNATRVLHDVLQLVDSKADLSPFGSGSIFTDFADEKVLVRKIDGTKFTKNLTSEDSKNIANIIKDFKTNKLTRED